MPDRDVFTYRVPKGWKSNARLLFRSEIVPEIAIERVSRRCVSEFRQSRSTAISEMIALLDELRARGEDDIYANDISIVSQLRRIATNDESRWGELGARRFSVAATLANYSPEIVPADLGATVMEILADYIEQRITCNGLVAALITEEGYSQEYLNRRTDEIRTMLLVDSDVLRSAASQLLNGVEAQKIKLPERKLQSRSTTELVSAAF